MMIRIVIALIAAAVLAGAVEYWLWRQGVFAADRARPSRSGGPDASRRTRVLTDSLSYVGAIFIVVGSGVAVEEHWLHVTSQVRAEILAAAAICLLLGGFAVRWVTASPDRRLTEALWIACAACLGGTAGIAWTAGQRQTAASTLAIASITIAPTAAVLWLLCRREMLLVTSLAGLTGTACGTILIAASHAAPWLAAATGLWLIGIAWVILGTVYPEPLGTSMPLGAAAALLAPAILVHDLSWISVAGIATAAAAMAASVPLKNTVILAFGSLALLGYLAFTLTHYAGKTLGAPVTIIVAGLLLVALALLTTRLGRATRPLGMPPSQDLPTDGAAAQSLNERSGTAAGVGSDPLPRAAVGGTTRQPVSVAAQAPARPSSHPGQ